MKIIFNNDFRLKKIEDSLDNAIIKGSEDFDKLIIYIPTELKESFNTIYPFYSVKRADGRKLGPYVALLPQEAQTETGYFGWECYFNSRDLAVAGPLEITISFFVNNRVTKNAAMVTTNVRKAVVVDDDVYVLNDSQIIESLLDAVKQVATYAYSFANDVVQNYSDLSEVDPMGNTNFRVVVLNDSNHDDNPSMYEWNGTEWDFKGYFDWTQYLDEKFNSYKDELDERITTEMASITQPKYYSTSSLPTSDVGLVVGSDGYIYSWNGTAYTSTGIVYQATQLADNSVNNLIGNESLNLLYDYDKTPLTNNYKKFAFNDWEFGYITTSNGNNQDDNYSIRNKNLQHLEDSIIIINKDTSLYRLRIYTYNSDGSFVSSSDWIQATSYVFNPDNTKKYRFVLSKVGVTITKLYDILLSANIFYVNDTILGLDKLNEKIDINSNGESSVYSLTAKSYGYNKFIKSLHYILNNEIGFINNNGNTDNQYNNCFRTIEFASLTGNITFINKDTTTYRIKVFTYDNSKTFIRADGWYNTSIVNFSVNTSYYYKLCIARYDNNVIDINDALSKIGMFYVSDKLIENNITSCLKSKIIFGAHQGGIFDNIPQNTLQAFNNCWKYGFNNIEFDVLFTSDRVPVISHDNVRTDVNNVSVTISETTYADLLTHQFYSDSNIKIANLWDTLQIAKIYGYEINLEFKTYEFTDSELLTIMNYVKSLNLDVIYSCVHSSVLLRCRTIDSKCRVTLGMVAAPTIEELTNGESYAELRTLLSQDSETILSINSLAFTSETVSLLGEYQSLGYKTLIFYQGSSISDLTMFIKYVNYLLTNYYTIKDIIENINILSLFN